MHITDVYADAFERIYEAVHEAVEGLDADQLNERPGPDVNSISWLVWHLTRIQDDHVADVAGTEQAWTSDGWAERFGLPFDVHDTGYGHTSEEVAATRVASGELLLGYYDAVHERTIAFVRARSAEDLDRVVDDRWTPPVTLGVRLVSVVADDLQHAGQAAYVRGLLGL